MIANKTVFIIITRGFLVRNMLRSGVLRLLNAAGIRTVIFFPLLGKTTEVPSSLRKELEGPLVKIIGVREARLGRIHKVFCHLAKFLVFTKSTWTYCLVSVKNDQQRSDALAWIERLIFSRLSQWRVLKRLARAIEEHVFRQRHYAEYFEAERPSVVFSTSIISTLDLLFMKEARRRGIPTISIPKGWDNIAKIFYRFLPDRLLVQNEPMVDAAATLQDIPRSRIQVVGFPQFDWYVHRDLLMSRESYGAKMGLDPQRRIILFGSEGKWAPSDFTIAEHIAKFIQTPRALAAPCSLLIRPHFSEAHDPRLTQRSFGPHVVLDTNFTDSNFFLDRWDPRDEETLMFMNTLFHMDVLVTTTSTLVLDAACFDKPIVNVAYEILYKNGRDVSGLFYEKEHYQWVLRTGAVDLVTSDAELLSALNESLAHPEKKATQRQRLRDEVCYLVDGQSSQRVVGALRSML